ncbi:MAG: hypothetical protein L0Z50_12890, partial [Verrucomicrobiales bacterium]|nr:hypothetical protein [Verrucomicrobiales bacterium]
MKPYYKQDGIVIYHSDCREVLPTMTTGSVGIVMTSPPYNTLPTTHAPSGLHGERRSGINKWINRAVQGYSDTMPEEEYQKWLVGILSECLR